MKISDDDISSFHDEGFVVIPDFLTAAEVARASESISQQAIQLLSLMEKFQLQDLGAQSDPWNVEEALR